MHSMITAACSLGLMGLSTDAFVDRFDAVLAEYRPDRGAECRVEAAAVASIAGTIKSVSEDGAGFVLVPDERDEEITISVQDTTVYTLNGITSSRDEALAAGRSATVTHQDNVASRVDVTTPIDPAL
ncbi:MAG: hypothetical protein R3B68_06385 [Phycisphaerales bacterium]